MAIEWQLNGLTVGEVHTMMTAQVNETGQIFSKIIKKWDFESDPSDPQTYPQLDYFEEFKVITLSLFEEMGKLSTSISGANPRKLEYTIDLTRLTVADFQQLANINILVAGFAPIAQKLMDRIKLTKGSFSSPDVMKLDYFEEWVVILRAFESALKARQKK